MIVAVAGCSRAAPTPSPIPSAPGADEAYSLVATDGNLRMTGMLRLTAEGVTVDLDNARCTAMERGTLPGRLAFSCRPTNRLRGVMISLDPLAPAVGAEWFPTVVGCSPETAGVADCATRAAAATAASRAAGGRVYATKVAP
ncbi:MAG: hypothetical protein FJ202_04875 [Gemmatimonadetes bacterium]|nr:hypothetical protein [Gemmatimonadota bacterium]